MRKFLSGFFQDKVVTPLKNGKDAVKSLAKLPERYRELERECSRLRLNLADHSAREKKLKAELKALEKNLKVTEEENEHLSQWVDEESARARKLKARSRLIVVLHRMLLNRKKEAHAETIEGLSSELLGIKRDSELLTELHERSIADLKEAESRFAHNEEKLSTSLELSQLELLDAEERGKMLAEREQKLSENVEKLENKYKGLMTNVRNKTKDVVEKLVHRGMPSEAIMEMVPDVEGLFSDNEIEILEASIRQSSEEQEALFGLQCTAHAPEEIPIDEVSSETPLGLLAPQMSFFERIFSE